MKWVGHVARMEEEKESVLGFGEKAIRKETIWKIEA
jgi:hypothetical protein